MNGEIQNNHLKDRMKEAKGENLAKYRRVVASVWHNFLCHVNNESVAAAAAHDWLVNNLKQALENPETAKVDLVYGDREFDLMDEDKQALTQYLKTGILNPGEHYLAELPRLKDLAVLYRRPAHEE